MAPSALRTPISRVRSVTETSMMFMIPIPPTSRLTAAMPASRKPKVCVVCWKVDSTSAWLRIWKSFSPPVRILCWRRSTRSISIIARFMCWMLSTWHGDGAQPVGAHDAIARGLQRDEDLLVGVLKPLRALLAQDADDVERDAADLDFLPDHRRAGWR